jgi:hypothetical protein
MTDGRRANFRFVCLCAAAPALLIGTTWGLYVFQSWLARIEDRPIRAFSAAYLLPLALITLWGGRTLGAFAFAAALFLAAHEIMPPRGLRIDNPTDVASLLFLMLTGSLAFAQTQRFVAGTPSVAANCTRVISTPQCARTAASNHEARTQTRITGTMPLRARQLGPTITCALGVEAFFFDDTLDFFPDLLALFFNLIQGLPTNRKFLAQFVFDAP